jgi:Protein of unknown function (DUF3040)
MSLSAKERHALDCISEGLTVSDPALAALLGTFTRLNATEGMPAREQIQPRPYKRCTARRTRRIASLEPARRPGWLPVRAWIRLLLVVLLIGLLISAAVAFGIDTAAPCTVRQSTDCPLNPAPSAAAHAGPS